jgi:hypothetical protein
LKQWKCPSEDEIADISLLPIGLSIEALIRQKVANIEKLSAMYPHVRQTLFPAPAASIDSDTFSVRSLGTGDDMSVASPRLGPSIDGLQSPSPRTRMGLRIDTAKPSPLIPPVLGTWKPSPSKAIDIEPNHSPLASPRAQQAPWRKFTRDRNNSISSDRCGSPMSVYSAMPSQPTRSAPSIKDFEILKPISKGAFGSVYLAKKRSTGDYFAIKVLKKSDMVVKNQVTNVKAERMILTRIDSPFVVKLFFSFQSKDYLYLVMEYLNGGDCSALIKAVGCLDEAWAKRYVAEVVLALEYLHERGIVHRCGSCFS